MFLSSKKHMDTCSYMYLDVFSWGFANGMTDSEAVGFGLAYLGIERLSPLQYIALFLD